VVIAAPTSCGCCGSDRLSKLGEDVTETLEVIPRQWKVIQTVREKFSCRDCEKISQPPAPFHVDAARLGRAEPAGHDPVREVRPASAAEPAGERYGREGIDLSLSTLADQVGACAAACGRFMI
jgi:transposase